MPPDPEITRERLKPYLRTPRRGTLGEPDSVATFTTALHPNYLGSNVSEVRTEMRMANLGYDMESGKVARWLKQVGDAVERGEPVVEIETDKTTVEMEALASGTLVEIVAEAGAEVAVGEVIAYLE